MINLKKLSKTISYKLKACISYIRKHKVRSILIFIALLGVIITSIVIQVLLSQNTYKLGAAGSLLSPINDVSASKIKYNPIDHTFTFSGESTDASTTKNAATQISAVAHQNAAKGLTVTDPVNKVDFSLTPKYSLLEARQDGNRIVYPFSDGDGWAVYTMQTTGVKEDILLNKSASDSRDFSYNLGLGEGLIAKLETDGSIGVYGNTVLSGNVTTGTDADAALLVKARQNAPKNTYLFSIPKPVIIEKSTKQSSAKATYSLDGNNLKIKVTGLLHANYPLSIDPSIYVVTAQQFMQGNNETNIDFDVSNKLIKKAPTTGARFDAWNTTTNLPSTTWGAGTAAAGGYIYSAGGVTTGTTVSQTVNWAQFNTTTGTIDSPNPGSGACSGWCTSSAYNLPSARSNFTLTAYNGFLYAIGGVDNAGARQNTVYISKIGANGEPQLWHPTDTNKANWVYWYQDTAISSLRSDMTVAAYNNRMYLMGGRSTGGTPVGTVEIADIKPTGTLGTWTSSTALPYNLYGHATQIYNDRIYIIGGASTVGGAPISSIYYNKINSDGTLNSWVQTTSLSAGHMSNGGNFSSVLGAYLYVSGGCNAVNASGYCTTVGTDTQVASINADGSIDTWNAIGSLSSQRMGFGMVSWRNRIYDIGGCSVQNTTNGSCTTMLNTIIYGNINQDGDASTVGATTALNTAPCSGTTPTQCNLPGTANIGNMLASTIITNGYLYVIGGCSNNTCSTTLGNVAYVAISSTGTMSKPATCPNGSYQGGDWCVDNVNTIAGGLAAASPVLFGGRIYLVGGLNGTANTNTIVRTTVNNDGSISAWTSQSMTGVGATSESYLFAFARANPASASTNPGNLYILGGCANSSAAGCTAYGTAVNKCNIQVTTGAIAGCTTTGQLQIGKLPGDTVNTGGLGIMSGTVYANYIYLVGGVTPSQVDLKTVIYAQIDINNNIVPVTSYPTGSLLTTAIGTGAPTGTGAGWVESPNEMVVGRRRAAAFGYNGYIYAVGGYDGSSGSVLADIEFIKVNVSDGSLGTTGSGFTVSAVSINQRWGLSVPVSNSFAYVIGGCTAGASPGSCTARSDIIQTFQLYNNDSGAPSGYTAAANTWSAAPNRIGASSAILNGYIYNAGGCTSTTDCTNAVSDVSYAPIDANGTIGAWASTTAGLPSVRAWGKLEAAGGTLYYIGGQSSAATDLRTEVYYATPVSGGNITGSWGTASNGLPSARSQFAATVWNNRIYVLGGEGSGTGCTAGDCNTVFVSPQLNSGGNITSAWNSAGSTSFNVNRAGATVVAYANNLYLFGGYDGTNYLSDSQYSQINSTTGLAGSWAYSTSLPSALAYSDGFAANGYVYLLGGQSAANACDPVTLVAPISANTTISSGNLPTGIGAWYETNQRYTGSRYGASAAYKDGKAYVLGGANCVLTPTKQIITTQGAGTFTVPAGVTSVVTKIWGGGGGGGGGGTAAAGGNGSGAGYTTTTLTVTPGEVLNIYVGGGGNGGSFFTAGAGAGGGGGGESGIQRSGTSLIIAAGGGAGGGGRNTAGQTGGVGGPGGGTTGTTGGTAGGTAPRPTGGVFGTQTGGGAGGTGGFCAGQAGASLDGGNGADGRSSGGCTTGSTGSGGGAAGGGFLTGGGAGGGVTIAARAGGGGGGSGYFGGGGGSNSTAITGASGGGGGSGYYTGSGSTSGGTNQNPGNFGDTDRGTAGIGGTGGAAANSGTAGSTGEIVLSYDLPTLSYPATVIQQTTLLSQPQLSKYSIMIDTDSDVFPTSWLLNGVDNSIGANWQLKYRSMTNPFITDPAVACTWPAMTTWGQETNFGNVILGLPGTYTPLDASGTTTNCARFYYFNVNVDSSQAFGYPDDVSRGPTITDLTLQFTADPSKRLMHGRTFTGGLQQPVDTPYYTN